MKKHINYFASFLIVLLLGASQLMAQKSDSPSADYLFTNGKVYTANKKQPWAEAVAIKGKEIVFVGSNDNAKAFQDKHTKVTDLNGKMLLPGFIDTHAHPLLAVAFHGALVLDPKQSIENWIGEIKKYVKDHPDLPYYVGFGYLASTFGPEGPKKELLDAISTDKAIALLD